jgi:uncharacterized protein with NRDE domain
MRLNTRDSAVCTTSSHSVNHRIVCTLALYLNVFDELPLLLAANRDEHFDRPSAPPAEIVGVPRIVAGRDLRAGGTWLGVNEHGLMVGILNRRQNGNDIYTPVTSMARSRGLLCMDILRLRSVDEGFAFITAHQAVYNPFTLVFADRHSAGVAHNNHAAIFAKRLGAGVHVFSSAAELDLNSAKADRAHARFAQLKERLPAGAVNSQDWLAELRAVLADHSMRDGSSDPGDAICVHRQSTGTVSSSVVTLRAERSLFETYFCPGPPCQNDFSEAIRLSIR